MTAVTKGKPTEKPTKFTIFTRFTTGHWQYICVVLFIVLCGRTRQIIELHYGQFVYITSRSRGIKYPNSLDVTSQAGYSRSQGL